MNQISKKSFLEWKTGTLHISELFCLDANDERITSNHICCEEDLCFGLSVCLPLKDSERESHFFCEIILFDSIVNDITYVFLSDPWPSVDFPYMCRIKVR